MPKPAAAGGTVFPQINFSGTHCLAIFPTRRWVRFPCHMPTLRQPCPRCEEGWEFERWTKGSEDCDHDWGHQAMNAAVGSHRQSMDCNLMSIASEGQKTFDDQESGPLKVTLEL